MSSKTLMRYPWIAKEEIVMRHLIAAALLTVMTAPAALADEGIDANEAWIYCDEAAMDEGFAEAGIPEGPPEATVVHQLDGPREGEDLILVSATTDTGGVFCMLDLDMEVLLYKFRGAEVIDRM